MHCALERQGSAEVDVGWVLGICMVSLCGAHSAFLSAISLLCSWTDPSLLCGALVGSHSRAERHLEVGGMVLPPGKLVLFCVCRATLCLDFPEVSSFGVFRLCPCGVWGTGSVCSGFPDAWSCAQSYQSSGYLWHVHAWVSAGVCLLKHVPAASHLLFMSCAMRESMGTMCYPEEPGCSAGVSWLSLFGQKIQTSGIS